MLEKKLADGKQAGFWRAGLLHWPRKGKLKYAIGWEMGLPQGQGGARQRLKWWRLLVIAGDCECEVGEIERWRTDAEKWREAEKIEVEVNMERSKRLRR